MSSGRQEELLLRCNRRLMRANIIYFWPSHLCVVSNDARSNKKRLPSR
jgi:hypothetical protein